MVSIRGDFTEAMKRNMYDWFFEKYDQVPTVHDKIFNVVDSKGAYAQSTVNTNLADLVEKPEADDIVFEHVGEGRIVVGKNRTFAKGIELSKEAVEDFPPERTANVLREYASQWGESVRRSKEKFAAKFFNNGGLTAGDPIFNNTISGVVTDPSGNLVYDGKPFFNLTGNARSSLNGTATYYNGHALALSSTNLPTVYQHMTTVTNRDENDEVVSVRPTILLIPPALRFTAKTLLESDRLPGGGNNDINVLQNLVQMVEWEYLTDTDAWFLGVPKKGINWSNRQEPVIDFYQDPRNKNYYATINARWGAWVDNWRFWAGSQFATS